MAIKKQATNKLAKPVKPAKATNKNTETINKKTKPKPRGRPSKYQPEFVKQVYKLCLLGATDLEIADFFNINEVTLNRWKKNYSDFCMSIKRAKYLADANIAKKLYERAKGYSHPEEKIFNNEGSITRASTIKHYPPDPTSMIFWLKNRQPDKWRDKQEVKLEVTEVISERLKKARSKNANKQ